MSAGAQRHFVVRGWHVLVSVVAFFAVVISLDMLFVVWAVDSFPGEVSGRAYEDGIAYDKTLAARRAQARLGWTARVTQGASPGQVAAEFRGPDGETLDGLTVKATFTRPATDHGRRVAVLRAAPGKPYVGAVRLDDGAWDLTLTASDARGRTFEAHRRLVWR